LVIPIPLSAIVKILFCLSAQIVMFKVGAPSNAFGSVSDKNLILSIASEAKLKLIKK
jgi:hypothetical protein